MDRVIQTCIPGGIGVMLLLSLMLNFRRKFRTSKPESKVFFVMLFVNLFLCILEPMSLLLDGKMFPGAVALSSVINTLLYMASICFSVLWATYAEMRVSRKKKVSGWFHYLQYLPAAIMFIGSFVNLFTPVFFEITPDNHYVRMGLFPMTYLIIYFYLIWGTVISYGVAPQVNRYVFLPAATFLTPVFIASIVQLFHYGVSLLWVGTAIGMTSAYMSLLDESSSIDTLSGAFSRHYLNQQLASLGGSALAGIAMLSGGERLTAGIMLDIDDFKQINDQNGHLVGDDAIRSVGRILRRALGSKGTVYRYAGDEFVILMKIRNRTETDAVIQRIYEEIEEFHKNADKPYRISFSIGQTVYIPGEAVADFVKRMDDDMYRDKKQKQLLRSGSVEEFQINPKRNRILLVDDDFINREMLKNIFSSQYRFEEADNGREGLRKIEEGVHGLCAILLDINMPEMNGLELLRVLHDRGISNRIPTFLITANEDVEVARQAYEMGVMDVIRKPIVPFVILRRVQSVLELFQNREALQAIVMGQEKQLAENAVTIDTLSRQTIEALASAIEFRDVESGDHTNRIYAITRYILTHTDMGAGFTQEEIESMAIGSIMHDIGKIAISDVILNKPGRLTPEEYQSMQQHTIKGAALLKRISWNQNHPTYRYACDIARSHHERWDGSGYPDGLKGDEITPWSQVVSIADVYDALISPRVYKNAYAPDKAVEMIRNGECGQFGPKLLACFFACEPELRKWYQENGELALQKAKAHPTTIIRENDTPREVVNVLLLMEAVKSVYDMIISVNLSVNRYIMIDYDRFLTRVKNYDGVFDELITKAASTVPESHRQAFVDIFSRESLLRAYTAGHTSAFLEHPQQDDNGVVHLVQTTVLMMEDSRNGDILEITLVRYVD